LSKIQTRVVGHAIYPDGRLKTVRYVIRHLALPNEYTLFFSCFGDPFIAKAAELGHLTILYKGQGEHVIIVADHWELPPPEFKLEVERVYSEIQPVEQACPERRTVAQARLLCDRELENVVVNERTAIAVRSSI
jgi:hypothetical protein